MKKALRFISMALAILLIAEILPAQAIADGFQQQTRAQAEQVQQPGNSEQAGILFEDVEQRSAFAKIFKRTDGTYTALLSADPIHFLEDGEWKEIDNTLEEKTAGGETVVENKENYFQAKFPESLSDNQQVQISNQGYTLSFSMLTPMKKSARAQIQAENKADKALLENASQAQKRANLAKRQSTVTYENAQADVDIEYSVLPQSVKENIILNKKPSKGVIYQYIIHAPKLRASLAKDKSVAFTDENENSVFTLPAPYMYDANGMRSDAIQVTLANREGGYLLTYSPSTEWLRANERVYPVVLDPVVEAETSLVASEGEETETPDEDTYTISSAPTGNYQYDTELKIKGGGTIARAFLFPQSQHAFSSGISSARLNLYGKNLGSSAAKLAVYGTTQSWDPAAVTHNAQPSYYSAPIDYVTVNASDALQQIVLDVTKYFAPSGSGIAYYGLLLKALDESVNTDLSILSSNHQESSNYRPTVEIDYAGNQGIDDRYDYHTQSVGRAGTMYVNDFSSNICIEREDIGLGGNVMPVQIKDYCNFISIVPIQLLLGSSWNMNYNQSIHYVSDSADGKPRISYKNGQGRQISYIASTEENEAHTKVKWIEETTNYVGDTGTVLWMPKSVTSNYGAHYAEMEIADTENHILHFNTNGYMVKMADASLPSNYISIVYNGGYIEKLIDGVGREYRFAYTDATSILTNKQLKSIQCFDADGNAITVQDGAGNSVPYQITYQNNSNLFGSVLKSVTYPDGKTVKYDYGFGMTLTDIDNNQMEAQFDNQGKLRIIERAYQSDGSYADGAWLDMTYDGMFQRRFTDSLGNVEIKQFDEYGRTVCSMDGETGDYVYATYKTEEIEGKKHNILSNVSETQPTSMNYIKNNSFEVNAYNWSVYSNDNTHVRFRSGLYAQAGAYCYRVARDTTGTVCLYQDYPNIQAGETYTLSAWVNLPQAITGDGARVCLQAWNGSTWLKETSSAKVKDTKGKWVRLETTLTVPVNATKLRCHVRMDNSAGAIYADAYQLEKTDKAAAYNYVENPDFTFGAESWQVIPTGAVAADTNNNQRASTLDNSVYRHTGSITTQPCLIQRVFINGKAGDTFRFGAWAKVTDGLPLASGRSCAFRVQTDDGEGNDIETLGRIDYNTNTQNWQYMQKSFTLDQDTAFVDLYLSYDRQMGSVMYDGVQLYKEEAQAESSGSGSGTEEAHCTCEGCEEADCSCRCASKDACTCVQCKRGTKETKDAKGNVTVSTQTDGTKSMETRNTYTASGNYLASTTNSAGDTVSYGYNEKNGQLDSQTDGNGNTVQYSYNAMQALTKVSQQVGSKTMSTAYGYTNDRLSSVTHNGFSYNFTYDSWGNQTGVKVGSQSLVTYSYGTGTNHNKLNSITYGNGQAITYQYDAKQNITGIKYSGDSAWRFTYTYDRQGNVKTATDNIAGTKATLDGDRMEVRKLSDNSLVYSSVTAEDGSVTETAFGKTYTRKTNDDSYTQTSGQTVKSGTITSPGTATALSEKTDYFGRTLEKSVLAKNGTAVTGGVSTSYEYKSASAAQTSDRVNILRNAIKTGANTSATKDFSYTYDGNGNLKTVQQVNNDGGSTLLYTYHYDAANQLTRVDDKVQDLTVVYAYNEGGNLVSRTNYKYTTGTPLLLKRTWLYSYDSTWKDQLAYYDAKRIQYDTVGNPTSYNGWAFTWEAGRQLASMSKSGTDVAYQYNADGLRTKKTVTQSGASTVYEYLWNESRLVGQKVGNDAVRILYDANDEPVGFTVNDSASYFYVKNLQGDVLAIVDKTGAEKVSYVYDAYGQIVSMTGDATLQKLNPCTYRGYYYDAETGLYYLQSRYYNPEWGRFINADVAEVLNVSQEHPVSANLFAYCKNNPVNMVDQSGTIAANVIGAVIGGVIGAVGGYFLTRWLADRIGLRGWKRNTFIWGLSAIITASAATIGYFVGPYVARAWSAFSAKLAGLARGSFKSIAKLNAQKMRKINVSKHLWKKVLGKNVTNTNIQNLIFKTIRSGTWKYQTDGVIRIALKYGKEFIIVTGNVVNNVFKIGDAWVWNGSGNMWGSAR